MAEDVLVIGAGPAGLASAYYLARAGISYRVVEKAEVVGATWANLYPSLHLNTTRFFSHLPGLKFPIRWGIFPTGKEYHSHLVEFSRRHPLNITLGVEVYRIVPENGGWRVDGSEGSEWYPAVISASGRFANPITAQIDGLDRFRGTVLHAYEFRSVESFIGKRVLIVGNGPSGVDISIAIGQVSPYPPLLCIRTGLDLRPRYPLGLPKHAWVMIAERLPKKLGQWLLDVSEAQRYRNLDALGLKPNAPKAVSTVRGPELIHAIRKGIVKIVEASAHFGEDCVQLTDGSRYTLDAVILATGYRPVLYKYLDVPYETDLNGWPLRDLSLHPEGREVLGYQGLYLVGVFYKGKGALYNCNTEAEIAVEQIKARLGSLRSGK
jgi:thioredoxin reductase